jgi:hypothetical protein
MLVTMGRNWPLTLRSSVRMRVWSLTGSPKSLRVASIVPSFPQKSVMVEEPYFIVRNLAERNNARDSRWPRNLSSR